MDQRLQGQSWLRFDVDFAYTRARFTDFDPVGNHIPGAPTIGGQRRRGSAENAAGSVP